MDSITKLVKNPWFLGCLVIIFMAVVMWNIPIEKRKYGLSQGSLVTDYTGLLPEHIERVVTAENRNDLQRIVKQANENGQKISIAGLQHSQGGHTYYKNGVVLDMRTFNRILDIDEQEKTIRVEAGATWEDVQEAIQPHGLALKVTQSQSIFTIGGSLSVNAHGRDIRFGSMAETVKEITLLTPEGEIKKVNRDDSDEWMKYVFGGYGLFGVILDVRLELTDNDLYTIHTEKLKTNEYASYFNRVLKQPDTAMHYARVSVAPSSFLDEMVVINYDHTENTDHKSVLKKEEGVRISKMALDAGRKGGTLENLFWAAQKRYIASLNRKEITRNNAMRSESTFMEYTKPGRVEVLQEFFVPVDSYDEYLTDLKDIIPANDKRHDFKVHNITVRYAAKDNFTTLNYAKEDMLGLVVLIQHGLKEEDITNAESLIQSWTNLTLEHGGTYYLPYYRYQTKEQFKSSYPNWQDFQEEKLRKDPNHVFQNMFYEYYVK
ncbi:FAD-binding oxidoreductase [Sporosarcina sp. BI001-red]|uniref:FAD-binding oxidoreductase n=1 Tax=Sporosarcina sp. BI001-red TaxID=2282866 RepID=UPI000E2835FB|nr:FAD-binding oxidoreductase [Sporosarcina sp. BI001-red]REB06405.1 FAD-binding oxidoreductase [Sporosarcina sp. BI001-red]